MLDDSLQSDEPADTEDPKRKAYFTDYDREGVLDHYKKQMKDESLLGISLPTYRLNYPPEEAQIIIRDQTRSTFLEEIVNPFRESLYINGFEPNIQKDAIFIQERQWRQKIIVKHIESDKLVRLTVGVMSLLFIPMVCRSFITSVRDFGKELPKLWTCR